MYTGAVFSWVLFPGLLRQLHGLHDDELKWQDDYK